MLQQNILIMVMGASLVTTVTADVAVGIQGELNKLNLSSTDLHELHMCLCTDANDNCKFSELDKTVTASRSEHVQGSRSKEYSNMYNCTLLGAFLECTRNMHNQHSDAAVQSKIKSYSLHNETCDMKCVGFFWNTTVTNITIHVKHITTGLCPVTSSFSSQNVIDTTVIIATAVACTFCFIIISAIVIYIRNKRKNTLNTCVMHTPRMEACSNQDNDISTGLYAVGSKRSWCPALDNEHEPLYYEIEKDKLNVKETRQDIELRNDNIYSHLHGKTEQVVNAYDVLPGSDSEC